MQNNWAKLLLMIEFVDNNTLFLIIFSISFFLNKDFHSHMSFELNVIEYKSFRECLQTTKVKNISKHMNKTLKFACESLVKTQEQMMKQVNKHRKKVDYEIESKMFLNERNIVTAKSFKKLDDKMLDSFINLNLVDSSYKLKLSKSMHVYDVFHSDLLRSVVDDLLSDQKNEFSDSIVINDEDEKSMIYWILIDIEDDFSIESNERVMTMISINTTLMTMNLWMFRKLLMIFIFDTWTNCTNQQFNQSWFNRSESVKSWLSNQSSRAENTFMWTWIVEEER